MAGDQLARVEVLGRQRGRHHQRLAGVAEALAGRAVDREFAHRIEGLDRGQVAYGVGVLGVRQPAQHHRTGIAGGGARHLVESALDEGHQPAGLIEVGTRLALGRHLAIAELLEHAAPDPWMALDVPGVDMLLEVEVALVLGRRMAAQAVVFEQRADRRLEVAGGLLGGRQLRQREGERAQPDQQRGPRRWGAAHVSARPRGRGMPAARRASRGCGAASGPRRRLATGCGTGR